MTHLLHHFFDPAFSGHDDRLQSGSQLVSKVRRHTDRLPVQIGVPFLQSMQLRFGQVGTCLERLQSIDQKLMPFQLVQQQLRVDARRALVPRVGERVGFVPVSGLGKPYENRVPQVLTFGNLDLQFSHSLSLTRVWPLVTTIADDANSRCRTVAWLYPPDLGNFPAESPLFLQAHSATFLDPGKSPVCEVDDDH